MQQPGLEYRGHVECRKVYTWVLKYAGKAHNQAGVRKGSWFGAKSGQAVLFLFSSSRIWDMPLRDAIVEG